MIWQNNTGSGPSQWSLNHISAGANGSHGFFLSASYHLMTLGTYVDLTTFANTGSGFAAQGTSASSIEGIRIARAFFGSDNGHEVYLDTYDGHGHQFADVYVEAGGTIATGPGLSTAAAYQAAGFVFSANNRFITLTGCASTKNSHAGIYSEAAYVSVTGSQIWNNGQCALAVPTSLRCADDPLVKSGAVLGGSTGSATATGNWFVNDSGQPQRYGVWVGVDAVNLTANRFIGNASAPIGYGVSVQNSGQYITDNGP